MNDNEKFFQLVLMAIVHAYGDSLVLKDEYITQFQKKAAELGEEPIDFVWLSMPQGIAFINLYGEEEINAWEAVHLGGEDETCNDNSGVGSSE